MLEPVLKATPPLSGPRSPGVSSPVPYRLSQKRVTPPGCSYPDPFGFGHLSTFLLQDTEPEDNGYSL